MKEAIVVQIALLAVGFTSFLWIIRTNWSNFKVLEDYFGFLIYCSSFGLFLAIYCLFIAAVSWWLGGYYQHFYNQGKKLLYFLFFI
jgi:hypothetical protein